MKRIISLMVLAAFASTAFLISFSSDAEAVPAFARKEGAECTLCHVGFPKLNSFGYEYLQRGFRMEDTDGIWVWENPMQFAGMAAIGYEFMDMEKQRSDTAFDADMETSKIAIGELEFFAAGNLAPKISFFIGLGYEDGDSTFDRGDTYVIFNDIMPDSLLNIKVGEFKTQLYWLSSSRKLGMTGYLGGGGHGSSFWETVEADLKAGGAEAEEMGEEVEGLAKGIGYSGRAIEINGILPTHTRYSIGAGNDGVSKTDNEITKVFAVLEQEFEFFGEEQNIGFVWVGNRIGQDNDNNMLGMNPMMTTKNTERTNLYGASIDTHLPIGLEQPLNVIFAYFYYDDDVAGNENGIESDYNHFIVEAILPIGEKIILEGLYERIDVYTLGNNDESIDDDMDFYRVAASLHYYFAPNVDLIFDYSHDDADVNLGDGGTYDLNQDMFMVMLHLGF